MTICKGCGREMRWIQTTNGKAMPVDPESVHFEPAGGPETFITQDGRTVRGQKKKDGAALGFVPHWATCPAAGYFKNGGRRT